MYFKRLSRNFSLLFFRNNNHVMTKSKVTRTQVCFFNSSKQYCRSKLFSNEEFDLSESLVSRYNVDYQAITNGNEAKIKELQLLLMKLELEIQEQTQLPKTINADHWRTLLTLSEEEIHAFFEYRLAVEALAESIEKNDMNALKYFEADNRTTRLFDESILERIPHLYDFNSLQAMPYGQTIVIDCSFEKVMPRLYIWSTAFHMFEAWLKNRFFTDPNVLVYCNLNPDGEFFSLIMEMMKETNQEPYFSFNWTDQSYVDLFPREDLIYLSPNSTYAMEKYNGRKIYIIGGLSPYFDHPVTYKKAKLEEIPTAKFPIDKYVDWGCGPKKLSISNCVSLLNDLKEGCRWNLAFRHLPKKNWARHPLDENVQQKYKKYRRPKEFIREKFRNDFLNHLNR